MSEQANKFKEKLLKELGVLEFRFNLNTGLNERIRESKNDSELYDCFNEIDKIENVMKRIYDLIDIIYDKVMAITPNELHNTIDTNKQLLKLKVSKEATNLEYTIEVLINIIELNVKDEIELIKSWTKAI